MWLLGGLWHMLIMGSYYAENSAAIAYPEPRMPFIILGYVILGVLMAYIYPKGYAGAGASSFWSMSCGTWWSKALAVSR